MSILILKVRMIVVSLIVIRMVSLFENINFSFEATLILLIKRTSIPPIIIMNRLYENQKFIVGY